MTIVGHFKRRQMTFSTHICYLWSEFGQQKSGPLKSRKFVQIKIMIGVWSVCGDLYVQILLLLFITR